MDFGVLLHRFYMRGDVSCRERECKEKECFHSIRSAYL